ncbi:DUF222 domain-containing protein [Pseudonocardia sp.]|uniref:DUF222 domain-containing protein n=1 Tax=Pseudonocardia sp. TaxID=60912 RepID=UPI00261BC06F|nr:DUF222 domain-containing protein [Pseudonocardia sp.]
MTAAVASEVGDTSSPADAMVDELSAMLARLGTLAACDAHTDDAARIDRIALLERVKAAAAAAQHEQMVAFARSQVELQQEQVLRDPRAVGRGIADQIALACHVSPGEGSRRLGIARALHGDLPATAALLREGAISEYVAGLVVTEIRHLPADLRREVDARIVAGGIAGLSSRRAAAIARRFAYEADPHGYVERGRTQRTHRRVGLRPAPDTMSLLTGYLPADQGVACWAALRGHADTLISGGDGRTRDQIMADTLVERVTGQVRACDVHAEVGIVMPIDSVLDPDTHRTAELTGYGPVPAGIARDILAGSGGRLWWRRLFTMPAGGPLVGGDPRRRRFDGWLARLIGTRDGGSCRDPFCDAPIRHLDHVDRHRAGGPTSFTNGRGVCARGNLVREMPGWTVETVHDGLGPEPHTVRTTTPTGHIYTSRAGPAP